MTPEQARDLRGEVEAASKQAQALFAGLDAVALTKRPAEGGWSVAEIVQHLILTADAMLPLVEAAVSEAERTGQKAAGSTGLGFIGWLLVKSLEPPARLKTKTIKPFEPVSVTDPLNLVDRFVASNAMLIHVIDRATGLATNRVKVVSPFNAKVKYNVYAAFRIMLAHGRRHLSQAEQAKAGT